MKTFLYQRGAETIALLQALARNEAELLSDSRTPVKIACAYVSMLLRPFGLEDLLPGRLAELRSLHWQIAECVHCRICAPVFFYIPPCPVDKGAQIQINSVVYTDARSHHRMTTRRELSVNEAQLLLFAIGNAFDQLKAAARAESGDCAHGIRSTLGVERVVGAQDDLLIGVDIAEAPGTCDDEDTKPDRSPEARIKTKVCCVS